MIPLSPCPSAFSPFLSVPSLALPPRAAGPSPARASPSFPEGCKQRRGACCDTRGHLGTPPAPRVGVRSLSAHLLLGAHPALLPPPRRLGLLLGLPHQLLDEPPGDDRQEQGGCRRGWPPVLVTNLGLGEQRWVTGQARGQEPALLVAAGHPAQAGALPSLLLGARLGWGCCGSRSTEKSPERSAQIGAAPEGWHSPCALLCASSPGVATRGTILAATRQEAAPASPQPHAALQVSGQNQPHFPQLFQQQRQHQTLPARLSRQAQITQTRTQTQAERSPEPGGRTQHGEPWGCCSDTPSTEPPGRRSTQA